MIESVACFLIYTKYIVSSLQKFSDTRRSIFSKSMNDTDPRAQNHFAFKVAVVLNELETYLFH